MRSYLQHNTLNTMKKNHLLCILLLFAIPFSLSAQLPKGSFSLEGNFGLGYRWATETNPGLHLPWSPGYARMWTNHIFAGAAIGGSINSSDVVDTESFLQPFIRYYFNPGHDGLLYFAGANFGIPVGSDIPPASTLSLSANRMIAPNLALEAGLGYTIIEEAANIASLGVGLRTFFTGDAWQERKEVRPRVGRNHWLIGLSQMGFALQEDALQASFSPNLALFFAPQWATGMRTSVFLSGANNAGAPIRSAVVQVAPFVRYYWDQSGRWHWFGELGGGWNASRSRREGFFDLRSQNGFLAASAGTNLFLAPSVALEMALIMDRQFDSRIRYDWDEQIFPPDLVSDSSGRLESRSTLLTFQLGLQFFLAPPER